MCGLSGIVSLKPFLPDSLIKSLEAIKHRGPDDTRIFSDKLSFASTLFSNSYTQKEFPLFNCEANIALGFNRLSIVDLSNNAMQPFYNKEKQIAFMLNGEVYNYVELRRLYLNDVSFISNSDSEVAYHLYIKFGDKFVNMLQGMFTIVIYDFKHQLLKAWRDPMGIKPFYYALVNGYFLFSSEIKGIFATNFLSKEIDYQGLAYSMYLRTCASPLTIYKNVKSLPAGHILNYQVTTSNLDVKSYWHLTYNESVKPVEFDEFSSDITSICQLYRTGEVPKGIMLSGGLDSGMLAYYIAKSTEQLNCFNIYTENHQTDEREFAALNALNANLPITYFEVPSMPSDDLLNRFLNSEEEPNGGPEPTLFLCEKASQLGIKVLYNALGPDEIFGGYRNYSVINKYQQIPLKSLKLAGLLPLKFNVKLREIGKFGWGAFPLISRQFFSWNEILVYFKQHNWDIPCHPVSYLLSQVSELYPDYKYLPAIKQASFLDLFYYIPSHHSFRSDQPSMASSIEMRFPFLDHHFIQKYYNQVISFKNSKYPLKPLFASYASRILPKKVMEMPKVGFTMPTNRWIEGLNEIEDSFFLGSNERKWYFSMLRKVLD